MRQIWRLAHSVLPHKWLVKFSGNRAHSKRENRPSYRAVTHVVRIVVTKEEKGGCHELGTDKRKMESGEGGCQETMGQAYRRRLNRHRGPAGSARRQNTGKVRYCERRSRQAG